MGRHDHGWFVIQTNPQSEKKADGELRRAGLRVYLPKRSYETKDRGNHGEQKVRWRPLLIGYLFVRFPDHLLDHWGSPPFGLVRGCQGVKNFVRVANEMGEWEPICVPDKDVGEFMRRQRRREFGRPAIVDRKKRLADMRKTFRKGSAVRVTDGPFATFLATLEKLNDDMTVDAEVVLFGRATKIRLSVADVEPESTPIAQRAEAA
jgi:transcription antitermination factor NusG